MAHYNMYETVELRIHSDNGGDAQADDAVAVPGALDTHSDTATPTVSGEGPTIDSAPPLPPPRSMGTDPVYTEPVTVSGTRAVHRPPATEGIVYDDITAFQNKDVQFICLTNKSILVIGSISGTAICNNW